MPLWYRIFGRSRNPIEPAMVRDFLQTLNVSASVEFEPDSGEWISADIRVGDQTIEIERFLAEEEGIRNELNSWAAFLESCDSSPGTAPLLEHIIQTSQLFTLSQPVGSMDPALADSCRGLVRFLARSTDGIYQVDEEGFYNAEGQLLVAES